MPSNATSSAMSVESNRIEICGGIASGKSTLANVLSGPQRNLVEEDFLDDPLWHKFYRDPSRFARRKNVSFLRRHAHAISSIAPDRSAICDYAVIQDLAYAELTGDRSHVAEMAALFDALYVPLKPPVLIVHLQCAPAVALERVHRRGRSEELELSLSYLSSLNDAISEVLRKRRPSCPVLALRSDKIDFATNERIATEVKRMVLGAIET
jgi:deoxyadenosine/deoxycytidine kinase